MDAKAQELCRLVLAVNEVALALSRGDDEAADAVYERFGMTPAPEGEVSPLWARAIELAGELLEA